MVCVVIVYVDGIGTYTRVHIPVSHDIRQMYENVGLCTSTYVEPKRYPGSIFQMYVLVMYIRTYVVYNIRRITVM